nr:single chain avidin precursor [synthetic construct]
MVHATSPLLLLLLLSLALVAPGLSARKRTQPTFGFTVNWKFSESTTVFTGQCFIDRNGKEVLKTMWLLRSSVNDIGDDWKATRVGINIFTRLRTQKEGGSGGSARKCSLTGKWTNDLGSNMTIGAVNSRGEFTGTYITAVTATSNEIKESPLHGTQNTINKSGGSTTVFTGQCFIDRNGKEVLKTMWLLRSSVNDIGDDWKATRVGINIFTRLRTQKEGGSGGSARKCSLTGKWTNDLGSNMTIGAVNSRGEFTGTYITAVTATSNEIKESPLHGTQNTINKRTQPTFGFTVNWKFSEGGSGSGSGSGSGRTQPTFGFTVNWKFSESTTVFTGQCFIDRNGKEVLKTMWLLRSSVNDIGDDWKATRVGINIFTRLRTQKEGGSGGSARKCSLTGKWTNDLGSNMTIGAVNSRGEFTGTYITAVTATSNEIKESPLHGTQNTINKSGGSTTVFTGQCFIDRNGKEVLKTMWLLRSSVNDIGDDWKATRVGINIFTRLRTQKEGGSGGSARKCSLTGKWTNDLGSNMTIGAVNSRGEFTGTYITAVTATSNEIKESPLHGTQNTINKRTQPTFGFTVNWKFSE